MPPRRWSRHSFAAGITDEYGNLHLTIAEPFTFRAFPDNQRHVVKEGDTLFSIAAKKLRGLPRPAGLFWLVGQFQPDGAIHDPTIRLEPGSELVVPSLATVHSDVYSEERRDPGEGTTT